MDFGRKVLEKYGWNEGEGLGKNSDGIKEAIKTKVKNNVLGLGYKLGNEYKDNWWENAYDSALSNIIVEKDKDNKSCRVKSMETLENADDKISIKGKKHKFRKFIKEEESISDDCSNGLSLLNDEEIFKKCGGRTAHKGARHGLTLSGKLARIAKQEEKLAKKRKTDEVSPVKKKKKKKSKLMITQ